MPRPPHQHVWQAFQSLSLYVEALCLHEWSLFTEQVKQESPCSRGQAYTLLTARPDNRPLTWERNQVDVLLFEHHSFTCPWTQKSLSSPLHYDLDHLLPLSLYPINELWNLVPVDKAYNQHIKRDRLPSDQKIVLAEPLLAAAYATYALSTALHPVLHEDAILRFSALRTTSQIDLPRQLAHQASLFLREAAQARYVRRC